jgi:hypothetical protein
VCAQAKDGQEASKNQGSWGPDLIILDVSMPVLAGIEAVQQIRVFLPDVLRLLPTEKLFSRSECFFQMCSGCSPTELIPKSKFNSTFLLFHLFVFPGLQA